MDPDEIHIAGAVVRVMPSRLTPASAAIGRIDGVEVRGTDSRGKLVVVLEASGGAQILALLDAIQRIDGVLNASLVYQHAESAQSMNQEVLDEGLAT